MTTRRSIYSIHERSTLSFPGWDVLTFELGHDPTHHGGVDMRGGRDVIARLNNGYGNSQGTLPLPQFYGAFSQRCANFVAASKGCTRWIIANEPNVAVERKDGIPILPADYARCYDLCRAAIHKLPDHETDEVLIAAVGPWNNQTAYAGNESGDWVRYFSDIQHAVQGLDGFAIHSYVREQTADSVKSTARMGAPFSSYHYGFRAYMDWMAAILPQYVGAPVYCTEFCVAGEAWKNEDTGCVRQAYQEIYEWNDLNPQQPILCLTMYRWQYDKWAFKDKAGVIRDFMTAVECGYTWPDVDDPIPEPKPPEPEPPAPVECHALTAAEIESIVRRAVHEELARFVWAPVELG